MTDLEALDAAIQTFASEGFASVTIGGQTTTMRSLDELLKWRDRLIAAQSATKPGFGLRFQKIRPVYE